MHPVASGMIKESVSSLPADLRHVHCGKVCVLHFRWLSGRSHDDQGVRPTFYRRAVVWQCVGLHRVLQRVDVTQPHFAAVQTIRTGKTPVWPQFDRFQGTSCASKFILMCVAGHRVQLRLQVGVQVPATQRGSPEIR
jgi:hypothetical protein